MKTIAVALKNIKPGINYLLFHCVVLFAIFLSVNSCKPKHAQEAKSDSIQVLETKNGLASYYSRSFDGKETASGKIFNSNDMVAAHPRYPLGTLVRLTNLEKGGVVEVRIIDRGPTKENQADGVIIDISRAAATKIGMIEDGRVQVKLDVIEWGNDENKP